MKISYNGIEYLKFKATDTEVEYFKSTPLVNITIVGECEINNWNGNISPQIYITDYEVKKGMKFYL